MGELAVNTFVNSVLIKLLKHKAGGKARAVVSRGAVVSRSGCTEFHPVRGSGKESRACHSLGVRSLKCRCGQGCAPSDGPQGASAPGLSHWFLSPVGCLPLAPPLSVGLCPNFRFL